MTADKTSVELRGQGVQLTTEDQVIELTGMLTSTQRQPGRATDSVTDCSLCSSS